MIKEAMLYEKLEAGRVRCLLCSHDCRIAPDGFGLCGVRRNKAGVLYTHVYGEVIASHLDPIEKKPLYHFLPGSSAFSIATVGCNFRCGFCQNWEISQSNLRDTPGIPGYELKPAEAVREARRLGAASISYTYTEPTVFFEYAYDTARLAKEAGLRNNFVTNGFMTAPALDTIRPYLDACNVDLKSFREDFYMNTCRARLGPVLDSVTRMKRAGIWVEVTTLVVTGGNESAKELGQIAGFIAGLDKDIPWHISRFHPDYKMTHAGPTPLETLRMARDIGKRAGLRYIYIGNAPGESEDTICYNCDSVVIERQGFSARVVGLKGPACAKCGASIAGVFI